LRRACARGFSIGSLLGGADIGDGAGHGVGGGGARQDGRGGDGGLQFRRPRVFAAGDTGAVPGLHRLFGRADVEFDAVGAHAIGRERAADHVAVVLRHPGPEERRRYMEHRGAAIHAVKADGRDPGRKVVLPHGFQQFLTYLAPRVVRHVFPRFFFWPLPRRPSYPDSPHRARARRNSAPVNDLANVHTSNGARAIGMTAYG
jgi:hypothetical protein